MTAAELAKVKEYQRDFFNSFNKKLEIDWRLMNGVYKKGAKINTPIEKSLEEIFEECVSKYKADIKVIRDKKYRIHKSNRCAERKALVEFSNIVLNEGYSVTRAAKIINKDRGCVYNFGLTNNM